MQVWSRKNTEGVRSCGIAQAVLEESDREEFLRQAMKEMQAADAADRLGVWLAPKGASPMQQASAGFRGLVWDRDPDAVQAEWERLAPEPPLPRELWTGGGSVEQELAHTASLSIVGVLLGLQRVLWTPVVRRGHLSGLLLAGSRRRSAGLPREACGKIASELALALDYEEERLLAREMRMDTELAQRIIRAVESGGPPEIALANLADSCVAQGESGEGPGAVCAVIGEFAPDSGQGEVQFHWKSGHPGSVRLLENEPSAIVWRRALEERRIVGMEPPHAVADVEISRLAAIPLLAGEELLGVLAVALNAAGIRLATLDRLEFRATLAASVLSRLRRSQAESRHTAWQHSLLESSREAVVLVDRSGAIAACGSAARGLLGESGKNPQRLAAASGQRLEELFRMRSRDSVEAWSRRVLSGTRGVSPENFEAELRNGRAVRVRTALPAGGELAAVILEPIEPGESAARHREQAELHQLVEWLEEGVILFDADENVRVANTRFEQMAGLAPMEAAKAGSLEGLIARLAPLAADPGQFAERWRALATGTDGAAREELHLLRPASRVLERAVRPILDASGHKLGRVEIYRDLTAQRVFQSRLMQTEKLAALGQTITGVAHELNNPLTSILGFAQRLLARGEAAQSEELHRIFQEAQRASAILRQLLQDARESRPERRPLLLNQVVLRSLEQQRFTLAAERVRVDLELAAGLPLILGDAGQLQQVVLNLLGNARQAIEQQGRGGAIRILTREAIAGRVLLEVRDDGPGIPEAILSRIFDPFFTTKPAGIGTGLGLAIVHSVVREHGGSVSVSNAPGGGAIFSLQFPAALHTALDDQAVRAPALFTPQGKQEAPPGPSPASSRGRSRGSVLVVEDEPTVARLVADVLEEEGFQVDILPDGRAALERAAEKFFNLVVCDIRMPGIDGPNFYARLARASNPLHMRCLFITGDELAPPTRDFLERNGLLHVAKPFRVEELTAKVEELLRRTESGPSENPEKKNVAGNG